jgi:hypothetical protein
LQFSVRKPDFIVLWVRLRMPGIVSGLRLSERACGDYGGENQKREAANHNLNCYDIQLCRK